MSCHNKCKKKLLCLKQFAATLLNFVCVCERLGNINNCGRNEDGVQTEGSQNVIPS